MKFPKRLRPRPLAAEVAKGKGKGNDKAVDQLITAGPFANSSAGPPASSFANPPDEDVDAVSVQTEQCIAEYWTFEDDEELEGV